jgi:hypothetical protein
MILKILLYPFLAVILFSFWPLLSLLFPAPFLSFLYLIHALLIILFLLKYAQYTQYSKFSNFEEAKQYYSELKRVERAERKAKIMVLKKQKIDALNKKKAEYEKAQALSISKLKKDLEERKKKVL